jgi:hypothetical protein
MAREDYGYDDWDLRRERMSFRDVVDAIAEIEAFVRDRTPRPLSPEESRAIARTALKIFGRGYVIDRAEGAASGGDDLAGTLTVRYDLEEAGSRFDRVSAHARRKGLVSSTDVIRIREACWHDVLTSEDEEDRRLERFLNRAIRGRVDPKAAAHAQASAGQARLADVLVGVAGVLRDHARRGAFPEDSEIYRLADGLGMVLLDSLGRQGLLLLDPERLCDAAARAYGILCRAEYHGRERLRQRLDTADRWASLFEGRQALRHAVLAGPRSPSALAALVTEELRLVLERQGPPGLGSAISGPRSILRDCAAALAEADPQEVVAAYRAIGSYPPFVRAGMRSQVLAGLRRALAGERQDMIELAPTLGAIDAEEIDAALQPGERMDYLSNRAVKDPPPKYIGRVAPPAAAPRRRFGIFGR